MTRTGSEETFSTQWATSGPSKYVSPLRRMTGSALSLRCSTSSPSTTYATAGRLSWAWTPILAPGSRKGTARADPCEASCSEGTPGPRAPAHRGRRPRLSARLRPSPRRVRLLATMAWRSVSERSGVGTCAATLHAAKAMSVSAPNVNLGRIVMAHFLPDGGRARLALQASQSGQTCRRAGGRGPSWGSGAIELPEPGSTPGVTSVRGESSGEVRGHARLVMGSVVRKVGVRPGASSSLQFPPDLRNPPWSWR